MNRAVVLSFFLLLSGCATLRPAPPMGLMWAFVAEPQIVSSMPLVIYAPDRRTCEAVLAVVVRKYVAEWPTEQPRLTISSECRQAVVRAGADYWAFAWQGREGLSAFGWSGNRAQCVDLRAKAQHYAGAWGFGECQPVALELVPPGSKLLESNAATATQTPPNLSSANSAISSEQETLFRVWSRDVGWNNIDLTITEVQRDERTSTLSVPRSGGRTAVEARFAMCAFTDLAFQRGFAVWVVAHPALDDDHVVVGFLKSDSEDARTVLGDRFGGGKVLKANARVMNRMCGIKEPGK